MASVQCYSTCEESCQQKSHNGSSMGHKVTDMFKGHHNYQHNNAAAGPKTQPQCYGQTQMVSNKAKTGQCATAKTTQTTEYRYSQTQTTTTQSTATNMKCHGNGNGRRSSRGEHKRNNLFQKIKDGLSGHSSDSCSSSDSDSDSDSDNENENCRNRRKNCN